MFKRTLTTVGLWLSLTLILFILGPTSGVWILLILSTAATHELCNLLTNMGYAPLRTFILITGACLFLIPYYFPNVIDAEALLALVFIALSLTLLYRPTQVDWLKKTFIPSIWALIALPYLLHFFIKIIQHPTLTASPAMGLSLIIWNIAMAKFTDVGGLLGGMLIGKTPLAPHISPKKTWEGAFCGIGLSLLIGLISYSLLKGFHLLPENFTWLKALMLNLIVACISIPSDLFESVLKRMAQVKDSGQTLPGIGGAFDLADSLLFVGPILYLFLKISIF